MRARCVPISATLSARGESGLTTRMASHVEACDRCAAEVADERVVRSELDRLAATTLRAPAEIVPRVMDGIGPWAVPDPEVRNHRLAVAAAAAVATAATAAAAGTAVLVRIHRHRAA